MIAGVVGLGLALQTQATLGIRGATTLARQRNFYGVLRVYDHRDRHPQPDARLLQHGGITHGLQLLAPAVRLLPTTYYGYESGVGQILRHTTSRGPRRIGAVGLGIGTIASYIEAGDVLRFYEISKDVERVARQYFSFLSHAQGEALVVLGDARLSMEREPPQEYDLLVLDAFSGDAIPVHLLTREAFDIYLRHLKPSGIIAVHISNHHLDLQPVVARLAEESQMQGALVRNQADERTGQYLSNWVILTPDVAVLRDALTGDVTPLRVDPRVKLWTDDYSSLFPVLK